MSKSYTRYVCTIVVSVLLLVLMTEQCPPDTEGRTCTNTEWPISGATWLENNTDAYPGEKRVFGCPVQDMPYPNELTMCLCEGDWIEPECADDIPRPFSWLTQSSTLNSSAGAEKAVDGNPYTCYISERDKVNYWVMGLQYTMKVVGLEIVIVTDYLQLPTVAVNKSDNTWETLQCSYSIMLRTERGHESLVACYSREKSEAFSESIAVFSPIQLKLCDVKVSAFNHSKKEDLDGDGTSCWNKAETVCDQSTLSAKKWPTGPRLRVDKKYSPGEIAIFQCPGNWIPYPTKTLICQCDGKWGRKGEICLKDFKVPVTEVADQRIVDGDNSTCVKSTDRTYLAVDFQEEQDVVAVRVDVKMGTPRNTFCPDIVLKKDDKKNLVLCEASQRYTSSNITVCLCYSTNTRWTLSSGLLIMSGNPMTICEVKFYLQDDYADFTTSAANPVLYLRESVYIVLLLLVPLMSTWCLHEPK